MLTRSITILVVDDHALVRGSLCERLSRESGFEIVPSAATAEEAVDRVLEHRPAVALMDIDMPGLDSFEAARKIASLEPRTRIIFLSAFYNDRYIEQALSVRARGYLTKREPPEVVVQAVREVADGGAYFSDEVRSRMVIDSDGVRLARASATRASTLTRRELEILRYIARGLSKKEIAAVVHLSVKTVDRHAVNLMTKLDIHDRVDLARYAIREGLAEA